VFIYIADRCPRESNHYQSHGFTHAMAANIHRRQPTDGAYVGRHGAAAGGRNSTFLCDDGAVVAAARGEDCVGEIRWVLFAYY
jgi:hypothetical protein